MTTTERTNPESKVPEMAKAKRCFKREERPVDVVGAVVFLVSEGSDFMTGQSIIIDGGDNML